jgi:hypothetical protein
MSRACNRNPDEYPNAHEHGDPDHHPDEYPDEHGDPDEHRDADQHADEHAHPDLDPERPEAGPGDRQ